MSSEEFATHALEVLKDAYDRESDDFAWDKVEWNSLDVDLLQKLSHDRKAVLSLVYRYISSSTVYEKLFAIMLAGSLMNPVEDDERGDARDLIKLLSNVGMQEKRADYLDAIAGSLGYPYMIEAKNTLLRLSKHPDKQVRLSATISLGSLTVENDSDVLARLHELKHDEDEEVRDWAGFNLEQTEE